jgi:hypothetical protein
MLERTDDGSSNVLAYEITGKLTEEEFETVSEEFKAAVAAHGKVRLLVRVPAIPSVELGALAEDLNLAPYAGDIERHAIVSDSTLIEWGEKVAKAFVGGEAKHFGDSRYEEAQRWVRS